MEDMNTRDVTEFEFVNVRSRTFSTDSKFDECFKRFVVECKFVGKSLFYDPLHMHRQPENADFTDFSK